MSPVSMCADAASSEHARRRARGRPRSPSASSIRSCASGGGRCAADFARATAELGAPQPVGGERLGLGDLPRGGPGGLAGDVDSRRREEQAPGPLSLGRASARRRAPSRGRRRGAAGAPRARPPPARRPPPRRARPPRRRGARRARRRRPGGAGERAVGGAALRRWGGVVERWSGRAGGGTRLGRRRCSRRSAVSAGSSASGAEPGAAKASATAGSRAPRSPRRGAGRLRVRSGRSSTRRPNARSIPGAGGQRVASGSRPASWASDSRAGISGSASGLPAVVWTIRSRDRRRGRSPWARRAAGGLSSAPAGRSPAAPPRSRRA